MANATLRRRQKDRKLQENEQNNPKSRSFFNGLRNGISGFMNSSSQRSANKKRAANEEKNEKKRLNKEIESLTDKIEELQIRKNALSDSINNNNMKNPNMKKIKKEKIEERLKIREQIKELQGRLRALKGRDSDSQAKLNTGSTVDPAQDEKIKNKGVATVSRASLNAKKTSKFNKNIKNLADEVIKETEEFYINMHTTERK